MTRPRVNDPNAPASGPERSASEQDEAVVEIDALDNEDWEKDQHTPIAGAELAELVKQTKAEPAKPPPPKPTGRPSTVSRSPKAAPPGKARAAKPTAKQSPVAADVAKSKPGDAKPVDDAPTTIAPLDPELLLEALPPPPKAPAELPSWARAPVQKTTPPPDPSPLPAPLPVAPPPDLEPVRAAPILPALTDSSVVAARPRRRRGVLVVLGLVAAAGVAIAIALAASRGGDKKQEPAAAPPVAAAPPAPAPADAAEPEAVAPPAPEPAGSAAPSTLDPGKRGKPVVLDYDQPAAKAPAPRAEDDAVAKARAHYAAGNQRLFAGDADSAIREYKQSLAIYPGYVASYRGLGLAYTQQNDKAKALQALRTYVTMVPSAKDAPLIRKRIATLQGH